MKTTAASLLAFLLVLPLSATMFAQTQKGEPTPAEAPNLDLAEPLPATIPPKQAEPTAPAIPEKPRTYNIVPAPKTAPSATTVPHDNKPPKADSLYRAKPTPAAPKYAPRPWKALPKAIPPSATYPTPVAPRTAAQTPQYKIQLRLIRSEGQQKDRWTDEKTKVLASPTLVTIEARTANIMVGGQKVVVVGKQEQSKTIASSPQSQTIEQITRTRIATLFQGIAGQVTVYSAGKKGKARIDADITLSSVNAGEGEDVRQNRASSRVLRTVELGKQVSIPFGSQDEKSATHRMELIVTKIKAAQFRASPVKARAYQAPGKRENPFSFLKRFGR